MSNTEPTIIVSGLPRSGTSMMMSMLDAGGLEVLTDNIRKADEDNPRGYYEYERVKKTAEDASWLDGTGGKAVKMISMLLYDLPPDREYIVIFMNRRIEEILASQRKMQERRGESTGVDDSSMARNFKRHLAEIEEWFGTRDNMRVIYVDYNDVLDDPFNALVSIERIIERKLDLGAMRSVVDEALYRQRSSAEKAMKSDRDARTGEGQKSEEDEKIIEQLKSLGYME